MNDFERDNTWQREIRNRFLAPWYRSVSVDGRFVFNDKGRCALIVQKRLAVDTIIQRKSGEAAYIEEKIVRSEFPNFFLETESCTNRGHESHGWMFYAECDFLHYCFLTARDTLRCYMIDFPALKSWFWTRHEKWPEHTVANTINHSRGRLVPVLELCRNVPHNVGELTDFSSREAA